MRVALCARRFVCVDALVRDRQQKIHEQVSSYPKMSRRFFESQNVPDQTARARTFIFCMELYIGILNRTIEAIF